MKKVLSLGIVILVLLASLSACTTATPVEEVNEVSYDVVVIGGGAAGLAAAIEAGKAGASVVLLEKLPMLGGSTLVSGGIVYGTGFAIQKEAGIEDSVDALVDYWMERAEGKATEAHLRFVAERSGATIDWLADIGVVFGEPYPTGSSPVARAVSAEGRGNGLIEPLKAEALAHGVEVLLQTTAESLIVDSNNRIIGLLAKDSVGEALKINANAVVIATGGFDRSVDLVKTYAPIMEGNASFSGVGNTGDGLRMALAVGADVSGNNGVIGFRAVEGELAYTTPIASLMWMPWLNVNLDGKRFANEALDYMLFYEELVKQRDGVTYRIFDQNTYLPALDEAVTKGSAFVADTLEDLAAQAGIDAEGLVATVENYNTMIANGVDTEFGKNITGHQPINAPKYYAVKIVPAVLGTLSGIKVDLDSRVLDTKGNPIVGLYAAGEVANGELYYKVYPGSGASLIMSFVFGRVAGENAAKLAK
jgi:fumarate reductase flavoprotein subunit